MPTIIFKATEACNSNCIYCDVVHRKQPRTIPLDILEVAYQRINEYLLEHTEDEMHIIWHGGEPCMAGLKLYTEALRFQETYCAETKDRIKYAVQSNLTMINQDFIDVFNKMGIYTIGTSYEPIPGVRGIGKKRDSKLYNKKFFEGINLLEANGMTWGFIYVVTKAVLDKPLEILYHLSNLKLHGEFNLHPVLVYNDAAQESMDVAITQEEFAEYLGITSRAISQWECERTVPDVYMLPTIASFFDISIDYLFHSDKDEYEKEITKIKESNLADFRLKNLGFVFQDFNLLDTLSVKDNIFLPLVLGRVNYQEMEKRIAVLAPKLHIEELLEKRPFELSGGQKQRVAIARSLITNPQLLLADEPTAALDYKNSEDILNLFEEINNDGQTLLMVTHSANAASHAKRVLFIKDGRIFHQIYRGNKTNQEFSKDISLAMTALLGGE